MVMTILEARVEPQNWEKLQSQFYSEVQTLDPGIIQTFLVRSKSEESLWRIITLWSSQAALDLMRASGETPRGVAIFHSADAQPTLSIFDILSQSDARTS